MSTFDTMVVFNYESLETTHPEPSNKNKNALLFTFRLELWTKKHLIDYFHLKIAKLLSR